MSELVGFQDFRSGLRIRDISPDSVIFSLFSSASATASVDRCSFASDANSHLASHLAGSEMSSGPDPDRPIILQETNLNGKEKTRDSSEAETLAGDSARSSFSQALKECQHRRMRSEFIFNLNNTAADVITSSSPAMKKPSLSRKTSTFPSPATPNYRHMNQKGWSSERVPASHRNANRRSVNAVFLPYTSNGKTLPSKWEDAERWIFSPMSGDGAGRSSFQQPQRQPRPKSKSGPLGPPGLAYYHLFSPAIEGRNKLSVNSPFSAGVMGVHGSSRCHSGGKFIMGSEPCMARSISIHGCTEILSQPPLPGLQDEKHEDTDGICRAVSRRDMATQMSPESSVQSSPRRLSSSIQPVLELPSVHSIKPQIRDVPIDERVTMTRWSRKNKGKATEGASNDWKRKAVRVPSSSWEVSAETSKSVLNKEEAKITAWENLQKAKAEAAIRKLEIKLEKKRASSMDKIMNKLRSVQKKAQDMRSSVQANQVNNLRTLSFRRTQPINSLSGCFTCPAF